MFRLTVNGIEFAANHGVSEDERRIGHRYRVDLDLTIDGEADCTDRLEDTADYGEAVRLVLAVSTERTFSTLEALARAIAERMLAAFPLVTEADVAAAKLQPPIPYVVASAGARVSVRRGQA